MKVKKVFAFMLAVVMTVCMIPAFAFADGEAEPGSNNPDGLIMDKKYDPETGVITLESYVTGSKVTKPAPADIVLVLDVSYSMRDNITSYTYTPLGPFSEVKNQLNTWNTSQYRYGEDYRSMGYRNRTLASDYWYYGSGTRIQDDDDTIIYVATQTTTTKIQALKDAVGAFIDAVKKSADENNVEHRISIVQFGNKDWRVSDNNAGSEASLAEGTYSRTTHVVKNLKDVRTDAQSLKTAVNNISIPGYPYYTYTTSNYGMLKAKHVLNPTENTACREDSTKVVVMFTDGVPTSNSTSFDEEVANDAIKASKEMKDKGAMVYAVGVLGSNPATNTNNYMNGVSSNYPKATAYNNLGTGSDQGYYRNAQDAAELTSIFTSIAQSSGGAGFTLTETAVMIDAVSQYFELPEGFNQGSISVCTQEFVDVDSEGNYVWGDPETLANAEIVIDDKNKTVSITGFDYSANWVGTETTYGEVTFRGKKLVVKFAIEDNGTGMGVVPTNLATSGIYVDGEQVGQFPVPKVEFPAVAIIHSSDNSLELVRVASLVDKDGNFDIKNKVKEGYLYGGRYNGVGYDWDNWEDRKVPENGSGYTWDEAVKTEDGGVFNPTPYDTYYIKEVPDTYLVPKTLVLANTVDSKLQVTDAYFITTVDNANYRKVGFLNEKGKSIIVKDVMVEGERTDCLWETVKVYLKDYSFTEPRYVLDVTDFSKNTKGLVACFEVSDYETQRNENNEITYVPYFVTPDNATINGVTIRTATIPSPTDPSTFDHVDPKFEGFEEPVSITAKAAPMMVRAAFSTISDDRVAPEEPVVPEVPEVPEEPEVPEVPEVPEEPEVPEVPEEPEVPEVTTVNVTTVIDGEKNVQILGKGNLVGAVEPAAKKGYLFAGWFTDSKFTKAADFSDVQEDITVYGKYIKANAIDLSVKQSAVNLKSFKLNVTAEASSKEYEQVGFIVSAAGKEYSEIAKESVKNIRTIRGAKTTQYQYTASMKLDLLRTGQKLTLTPYFITYDGTVVYGQPQTYTSVLGVLL